MATILFEDKEKVYTINEVAEQAHIHPQTLRNWERNGLLKPQRVSGNQRIYRKVDLELIEHIVQLKERGWNIQAIKDHFSDETNLPKGD